MSNREDRYHTTSWDGQQVQRQQASSGGSSPRNQQSSRPASGSQQASGKKKAKKRKAMNPILGILLWVVIVVSSSAIFAGVGWMLANDLCAFNKTPIETTVEIPEEWFTETEVTQDDGTTKTVSTVDMSKVAAELKEEGLIEYPWFFRLFSVFYKSSTKIKPGTYTLNTDMDYMALVREMHTTGSAETVDVTIPEGYSVQQIIDLLAEKGVGTVEDLTETAQEYVFDDYPFIDNENLGSISRLEGYLYPDTYNFYVGGDVSLAFKSMLSNFNTKVYANEDLSALFENSDYTFQEIITIASLIEKETDGTDREKISSVIYNRLENAGETAYYLQIDASLVYAAGRAITQEDYETLDSPYNLYQHTGLPPTPIANPGLASIKAALQPADTDYYYYVLGADGTHVFSSTLSEHEKAKAAAAAAGTTN